MIGDRSLPRASIVIRAYNEARHIERLLTGICQQALNGKPVQDIEVIVVDSGSTDGTVERARLFAAPFPIRIVHIPPEEFTFGRSLNLGIQASRSPLIVIASAHVYPVYPDWLERLLAPFSDDQVVLSYGKQRGNHLSHFSEQQIFSTWYPDQTQPRQSHPFCNNANAAIRRGIWEEHPYDESLSGLEDVEWANWAVEKGYAISYCADAVVLHIHRETPQSVFNRYRREAIAFKRIFPHQRFGKIDLGRLVSRNILSDLRQAARQKVLLHSIGSIFWFRWMQFWGTYKGYRHSGPLTWQLRQTFYYPFDPNQAQITLSRAVEPIPYPDLEKDT
ncbi:MAG TPA: glycosyltransferase [Anaerolineales bacterium]|nr:glycosyltransferase [Anaerolineales bacterium]